MSARFLYDVFAHGLQQRLGRSDRAVRVGDPAVERLLPTGVDTAFVKRDQRLGNQCVCRLDTGHNCLLYFVNGIARNLSAGDEGVAVAPQDRVKTSNQPVLIVLVASHRMRDILQKLKQACLRTGEKSYTLQNIRIVPIFVQHSMAIDVVGQGFTELAIGRERVDFRKVLAQEIEYAPYAATC